MEQEVWERWRAEVDKGQTPQRIDKYLAEHMTGTSRNRIQNAADAGNVWVNGKKAQPHPFSDMSTAPLRSSTAAGSTSHRGLRYRTITVSAFT